MIRREYSRAARAEGRLASARARGDDGDVKTSLDHLPPGKRAELTFVVDVLRESFAAEVATRQSPALRDGAILKIVLFGSSTIRTAPSRNSGENLFLVALIVAPSHK